MNSEKGDTILKIKYKLFCCHKCEIFYSKKGNEKKKAESANKMLKMGWL